MNITTNEQQLIAFDNLLPHLRMLMQEKNIPKMAIETKLDQNGLYAFRRGSITNPTIQHLNTMVRYLLGDVVVVQK